MRTTTTPAQTPILRSAVFTIAYLHD